MVNNLQGQEEDFTEKKAFADYMLQVINPEVFARLKELEEHTVDEEVFKEQIEELKMLAQMDKEEEGEGNEKVFETE